MKYCEVLTKRADTQVTVTPEDIVAAKASPEFQAAFDNAYSTGSLKGYASRISPGEIMRIALGATAGGGLGWLASRLLHKKPKAWRTALYTLGGAGIGGFGTHWYLNNVKDKDGLTGAQRSRRTDALNDSKVEAIAKRVAEGKKEQENSGYSDGNDPESSYTSFLPNGTPGADIIGFNNDANGWMTSLTGAGAGYFGTGFGYQQLRNRSNNRSFTLLNQLITAANNVDTGKATRVLLPGGSSFNFGDKIRTRGWANFKHPIEFFTRVQKPSVALQTPSDIIGAGGSHKGMPYIKYNADAPAGKRFSMDFNGTGYLQGELKNGVRRQKQFSRRAGVVGSIPSFFLASFLSNYRRKSEYEAGQQRIDNAIRELK